MITIEGIKLVASAKQLLPNAKLFVSDKDYNCPTQDYLTKDFKPWFMAHMKRIMGGRWYRRYDCDNWAQMYVAMLNLAHFISTGTAEGLAVAEVWYLIGGKNGNGHAIVLACVGPDTWVFIEPQTGDVIDLTTEERNSIWLAKF